MNTAVQGPSIVRSVATVEILSASLCLDGRPIDLTNREREVVIALALRPQSEASDLADMIWPDADGDRARDNLKIYVHRIRRRAAGSVIEWYSGRYRLAPYVDIDVDAIESRLRERGPDAQALAQMLRTQPSETVRWSWFSPYALRLAQLGRGYLVDGCRVALDSGDPAGAAAVARDLMAVDACDGEACELAIHAYLKLGEHGAAVNEYRRYAAALRSELDIEPASHIRRLLIVENSQLENAYL